MSVEKSEYLSRLLAKKGIKHEVLNAKNHAREAEIVARAGRLGAVTVATNMAGRGTDIMLGGNAEFLAVQELKAKGLDPVETPEEYEAAWDARLRGDPRPRGVRGHQGRRGRRPVRARHRAPRVAPHRQPAARSLGPSGRPRREPLLPVAHRRPHAAVPVGRRRGDPRPHELPRRRRDRVGHGLARDQERAVARSRRATPRSARTSSSTTTSSTASARRSTPTAATSCRATTSPTACSTSSRTRSTPSSTTTPARATARAGTSTRSGPS